MIGNKANHFWQQLKKPFKKLKSWITYQQNYQLANYIWEQSGGMIYSGPFASIPVPSNFLGNQNISLLLGSYERVLHPVIYDLIISQPKYGIVVGASLGYYVIGVCYMINNCHITAFESSIELHQSIKQWAEFAGVLDKVQISGVAEINDLINISKEPDFLIIDCEGAEETLLDPNTVPWLQNCIIICELHDFYVPGILKNLITRFQLTHKIQCIDGYPISTKDYPLLSKLNRSNSVKCVKEDRWILNKNDKNKRVWTTGRFFIAHPIITKST